MTRAKKKVFAHQIGGEGEALLRSKLPGSWELRAYHPDYGLDFALELFGDFPPGAGRASGVETLGEHIFIQLKTVARGAPKPLTVYGRPNVEKGSEALRKTDRIGEIDTYRFPLDVPELVTVDRMGIAIPVLLVIADLEHQRCSFVCLNDYIDKIILPKFGRLDGVRSRTIHVPVRNEIGTEDGKTDLHWYGKRAKLIAAFQRFGFQYGELQRIRDDEEGFRQLARYFADRIAGYDFWTTTPMWALIGCLHEALGRFRATGQPGITRTSLPEGFPPEFEAQMRGDEILDLWRFLAQLPKLYEDIWREFLLPTGVGLVGSYGMIDAMLCEGSLG